MKFKRFMALALAGVMTLAMAGSTMAAEPVVIPDDGLPVIEKVIQANIGVSTQKDATIKFKIVHKSGPDSAEPVPTIADLKVDAGTTISTAAKKEDGSDADYGELTKTTTISASNLTVPGKYEYELSEESITSDEAKYWTNDTASKYDLVIWVYHPTKENSDDIDYEKLERKIAIFESGADQTEANKKDAATFTNQYKPISGDEQEGGSLNLTKTVVNGQWSKKNAYNFTVTFTGTELTPLPDGFENPQTFDLADGANKAFENLPVGIKYSVVENETSTTLGTAYTGGSYKVGVDGQEESFAKDAEKKVEGTLAVAGTPVTFKNTFDNITPTGLAISVAPFIAMFAAVAGAIALYVAAKRRVR